MSSTPPWRRFLEDLVPTLLFGALLVTALVFRDELRDWFRLEQAPTPTAAAPPASSPSTSTGALSHEGHGHNGGDVAHYTCPMHPSVSQASPGNCPICGMNLTPVTFDEEEGGVVIVDSVRRQRIGVRLGEVEVLPMHKQLRAVGRLTYDETSLHDVTLKYRGWIEKLYANELGMRVKRGAPLFTVYSPEVYAAQGDLITALTGPSLFGDSAEGPTPLVGMAKERLSLLGAGGVAHYIQKTGKPVRSITVTAPASGYVVEKNVVDGSAVAAGARVLRIAGLDKVWVEADIYEADLPLVHAGQRAEVRLTHLPNRVFQGTIAYLLPYLDPKTRAGKARVELANPKLELKPDMFANVVIDVDLGERLSVAESAVIYTGPRRIVFVDLGEGRLRPTEVELGVHVGDRFEVLEGLHAGDRVVISGNFLVAAESRIRSAARYWTGGYDIEPAPTAAPAEAPSSTASSASPAPPATPPAAAKKHPPHTAPPARPAPEATVYSCPMHPEITSPSPGKCPICGMNLTPRAH